MSYLKEIAEKERKAKEIVEQAKEAALSALDRTRQDEKVRIEKEGDSILEKMASTLSAQKATLAKLYKSSIEEGRKDAQALKAASLSRRDRAIKKVISSLSS